MPPTQSSVRFRVGAHDPDGTFETCTWHAPTYPVIGDVLMVPDGHSHQDVSVVERVIYPGGVEVWIGGFDGWNPGSVSNLFKWMRETVPQDA